MTSKRKRDQRTFVGLHKQVVFGSSEWAALSSFAKDLYLLAKGKWKGPGLGDEIALSYREIIELKHTGLRNRKHISKAFQELEAGGGWLERTAPGGLLGTPQIWRLTFKVDQFGLKGRRRR